MRWLVGDLQGCAREFDKLLAAIRFDPGRDEIWCLGDLINRGPESLETLRLWRDVGGCGILGNHDVYALQAWSGGRSRKGRDTLEALFAAPDADELMAELARLPVLVALEARGVRGADVWIVHAGLHPSWQDLRGAASRLNTTPSEGGRDLDDPELTFAVRARCCTREGKMSDWAGLPLGCPKPYRPWDEYYAGPLLVVHGHWARRGYYRGPYTMGLDSGCVYGGGLTAWCQDEDRVVRVPSVDYR